MQQPSPTITPTDNSNNTGPTGLPIMPNLGTPAPTPMPLASDVPAAAPVAPVADLNSGLGTAPTLAQIIAQRQDSAPVAAAAPVAPTAPIEPTLPVQPAAPVVPEMPATMPEPVAEPVVAPAPAPLPELPPLTDAASAGNSGNFGMSPMSNSTMANPAAEMSIPSSNAVASLIDTEANKDAMNIDASQSLQPDMHTIQAAPEPITPLEAVPSIMSTPAPVESTPVAPVTPVEPVAQPAATFTPGPIPTVGGFAQPTPASTPATSVTAKKAGPNWGMLALAIFIFVVGVLALLLGIYYATNLSIPGLDSILRP